MTTVDQFLLINLAKNNSVVKQSIYRNISHNRHHTTKTFRYTQQATVNVHVKWNSIKKHIFQHYLPGWGDCGCRRLVSREKTLPPGLLRRLSIGDTGGVGSIAMLDGLVVSLLLNTHTGIMLPNIMQYIESIQQVLSHANKLLAASAIKTTP